MTKDMKTVVVTGRKKYAGRGGYRPGAGRHVEPGNEDSKMYTFRAGGEISEFLDGLSRRTEFIKDCLKNGIENVRSSEGDMEELKAEKTVTLPMFDLQVACGLPVGLDNSEHAERVDVMDVICSDPENCYMIRVKGESMKDVDIHDGDIVVIDRSKREPSVRDVAMCELNGEYTLKHFVREGDHGWLVPENKDFEPIEVRPGDTFNVWGVVKTVIHKF